MAASSSLRALSSFTALFSRSVLQQFAALTLAADTACSSCSSLTAAFASNATLFSRAVSLSRADLSARHLSVGLGPIVGGAGS